MQRWWLSSSWVRRGCRAPCGRSGLWIGRLRRNYYNVKTEIEREIGMDEVRRQLHNEQVMADVKRVEREVQAMGGGNQPH